jgi:predicted nucleic acid-binding Zn ribbon protein
LLSLLSLTVALTALGYNTYRNELSEHNRSIRAAEFEMLRHLIDVQQVVDYASLHKDLQKGDLTLGLNRVLLIRDLSSVTPQPVEKAADQLRAQWVAESEKIASQPEVAARMSEQIWATRQAVLASLRSLK